MVIHAEKVNVTESGKQAVLQLAGGDFRRVLNLLQSACMAFQEVCAIFSIVNFLYIFFRQVNEETIYLTAGAALPSAITAMLQSLLNDTFNDAYDRLRRAMSEYGYALCDINSELVVQVARLELPVCTIRYENIFPRF